MIALYVGLWVVAGVIVGGITQAKYLKASPLDAKGEEGRPIMIVFSAILWPISLGFYLIWLASWLLLRASEWVGERIMGVITRRKSDV